MAEEEKSLSGRVNSFVTRKFGIPFTAQPKKAVQLPFNPTNMPPTKLQIVYTQMVAWQCFAAEQLASVKVDLLECDRELRIHKATLRHSRSSQKKWEVDSEIELDEQMQMLEKRLMRLEAKAVVLGTLTTNYENKAKALSRELSRRFSEIDRSERSL